MFALMNAPGIIIAIDGYSSTGKSTFARLVASALGYIYVDTGALYRGVTLLALRKRFIDTAGEVMEEPLKEELKVVKFEFRFSDVAGRSELFLNGECVEREIRSLEVSGSVSIIARIGFVRNYVDEILHELGRRKGVVMDGRDIGTVVFPNAELKLFMTARPEVRARRRFDEMVQAGESPVFEDILRNVNERDKIDQNRDIAPLRQAPDAILLDNSEMTIEQQLEWLGKILEERWNLKLK